ncbi:MAG: MarR family transcriptional regulator, partial [Acidimicrobiales bacterium]
VVERLERIGLVVREGATEDRRGAYAVLTPAGDVRFRAALKAHVTFVREHFLAYFTAPELEQMAAFWQRLDRS